MRQPPARAATADGLGRTRPVTCHPDVHRTHLASRFACLHERQDRASRNELVLEFMPLARRIAGEYHTPRDREDLEQVAYLALLKAIDRFDPTRGNSFATYAVPTIAGEIKHYIRDHTWDIHVPAGSKTVGSAPLACAASSPLRLAAHPN